MRPSLLTERAAELHLPYRRDREDCQRVLGIEETGFDKHGPAPPLDELALHDELRTDNRLEVIDPHVRRGEPGAKAQLVTFLADREQREQIDVGRRDPPKQPPHWVLDVSRNVAPDAEKPLGLFEDPPLVGSQEIAGRVTPANQLAGLGFRPRERPGRKLFQHLILHGLSAIWRCTAEVNLILGVVDQWKCHRIPSLRFGPVRDEVRPHRRHVVPCQFTLGLTAAVLVARLEDPSRPEHVVSGLDISPVRLTEGPAVELEKSRTDGEKAMKLIEEALKQGRTKLSEYESKQVLGSYEIPITREIQIGSAGDLAKASQEIGYPLVLKGCSPRSPVVVKKEQWNHYTIIAKGNHLIHKINGTVTVEVTDNQADKRSMSGLLALQVHQGPPMTVQFKNVKLTPLGKSEAAASTEAVELFNGKDLTGWSVYPEDVPDDVWTVADGVLQCKGKPEATCAPMAMISPTMC